MVGKPKGGDGHGLGGRLMGMSMGMGTGRPPHGRTYTWAWEHMVA
jgi:hypothetical protein